MCKFYFFGWQRPLLCRIENICRDLQSFQSLEQLRNHFVTMMEVRRIQVCELPFLMHFPEMSGPTQHELEAALIRLHSQDGISILFWVEKLKSQNSLLAFKSCNDLPPKGSGLDWEAFILIIQCPYQQQMFDQLGNTFLGINATTILPNMKLSVYLRYLFGTGGDMVRK
jgi:hypothetical protein